MKRLKIYGLVVVLFAVPLILWFLIDAFVPAGTTHRKVVAITMTLAILLWISFIIDVIHKLRG